MNRRALATAVLAAVLAACGPAGGSGATVSGPEEQVQIGTVPTPTPTPSATASPQPSPSSGSGSPSAPTATTTPAVPSTPAVPVVVNPSGTVTITWNSDHSVTVQLRLSGMAPSAQYPVGLWGTLCQSTAPLLAGFPPATATSAGSINQTLTSTNSMPSGIPEHSSVRIGASDASHAVACTNIRDAITGTNQPFTNSV